MNPTTQSPTKLTQPARQQRILRLPEVKAKTGFGRSTIYALFAQREGPTVNFRDPFVLGRVPWAG
ncbi:AlpA family phage regulatory protein [Alteromonas sp. BMJM2]|uniref:AlpA family phage regulatory protein n=1 Tax=Alteromonas sp. BMJM2 TaxID=2954241 RepID=UPI003FA46B44